MTKMENKHVAKINAVSWTSHIFVVVENIPTYYPKQDQICLANIFFKADGVSNSEHSYIQSVLLKLDGETPW